MVFPKKSLGQHFLRCKWVIDTLIRAGELEKSDVVIEIGPGEGVLTRALAASARQIIAIEKDGRLASLLQETLKKGEIKNIDVVEGDILNAYPEIISHYQLQTGQFKIVANIPYYLTSHLLRIIFTSEAKPDTVVLTIQKEVAERIAAKPPKMSILALSIQTYGTPKIIKTVPASCFYPAPNVDSCVITISGISDIFFNNHSISEKDFFKIVKMGFASKRKQLQSNLAKYFDKEKILSIFTELKINPHIRAEELTKEDWANIITLLS